MSINFRLQWYANYGMHDKIAVILRKEFLNRKLPPLLYKVKCTLLKSYAGYYQAPIFVRLMMPQA